MTDVGPLVREAQLREVESQVRDAVRKGAKITCGGKRMAGSGYFFQPTVLENFSAKMKVLSEEVFGPVAPLVRVKDDAEAADWANGTVYGLGASVWTRDMERAAKLAKKLDAGVVFVNGFVKSDPRMPFGGVKESGYGREISRFGIREFTNVKGVNYFDSTA
jgi:succinate-semialdehyde dehydrogenase/glutarate-semialdehyde dehydrogenase/succinyl-CoA reductase